MAISVTQQAARRFMCRATGLDRPFPNLQEALDHLGHVQIDPINVCGRMHDLILRNRVADYCEHDLMAHLHGADGKKPAEDRIAFEHHLPGLEILVALPLNAWPHLQSAMRKRSRQEGNWSGQLHSEEKKLSRRILAQMKEQGPLSSQEIAGGKSTVRVWGSATQAKTILQKLFFHGRVLIAQRQGNRRYYDLPERVLPAATLLLRTSSPKQCARWLALGKMRQRRLGALTDKEHRLIADEVVAVSMQEVDAPKLYMLKEDKELMESSQEPSSDSPKPLLLAPLDPILYDRKVTAAVWNSDYRWEVYTPQHKRVRGYYALPILSGDKIVGYVDPKADRQNGKLEVVARKVSRGHSANPCVKELAAFLGLTSC